MEEVTSTTILSNYEYQVYKTLPTAAASTWNKTVVHLLSTGSSNFSNNVIHVRMEFSDMLEMVTWQALAAGNLG